MGDEKPKSNSLLRYAVIGVLFVGAVLAVNWVLGVAMAVLKWVVIGGIAVAVTWFVLKKVGGSSEPPPE